MEIPINQNLIQEAFNYSKLSRSHTSDNHDFHEGGLEAKQRKMFEGKLGEKGIKQFLINENISFEEDKSHFTNADEYDFKIFHNKKVYYVDVKTRTQKFHTRTLEMVKQFESKKINIYISVKLIKSNGNYSIKILGWCGRKDILNINRIENNGYLDNYVLFDSELRDIRKLIEFFKSS